jgi:hypothetical protein
MSDPVSLSASENVEPDVFDRTAQAGWKWFTKFLLINVIVCAVVLLFVGALTVWS